MAKRKRKELTPNLLQGRGKHLLELWQVALDERNAAEEDWDADTYEEMQKTMAEIEIRIDELCRAAELVGYMSDGDFYDCITESRTAMF